MNKYCLYASLLFFFFLQTCSMLEMQPLRVTGWQPEVSVLPDEPDLWKNLKIKISFSKEINKETVRAAFRLLQEQDQNLAGIFSWPDGKTLVFTPQVPFDPSHTYAFEVSTALEDIYGNSLEQLFRYSFAKSADSIRPQVTSYQPQGSLLSAAQSHQSIQLKFSESMNRDSVHRNFTINPSIKGSFSWLQNSMIFTPYVSYEWGQKYTVTLREVAVDSNGNSIGQDFQFSFTYGMQIPTPVLLGIQNATGVRSLAAVSDPFNPTTDISENWEIRDSLEFTFDSNISSDSLKQAIELSPYSSFSLSPSGNEDIYDTSFTLTFDDPLTYNKIYSLSISPAIRDQYDNVMTLEGLQGGIFYFRTNGSQSIPIEVVGLSYLRDPTNQIDIAQLSYSSAHRMDISRYSSSIFEEGFLDLHLKYASTATLKNSDFFEKIRVSVSGGNTEIRVYRLEMAPINSITINETVGILRIYLGIKKDSAENNSEMNIDLDQGLTDSLGNELLSNWNFLAYLKQS